MLGETLANLDHEPRFVQQSLWTATATICCCWIYLWLGLCADPALILRHDWLFASGVPAPYAAWLGSSLWRHCPSRRANRVSLGTGDAAPIAGSYAPARHRHRHREPTSRAALLRIPHRAL